jgi:flagellum-specific peptidoglycan hydrolase FlgJ
MQGETDMKIKDGDTVKSFLNGNYYKVKRIVKNTAVLESEDGQSQILTEAETLNLFYNKETDIKA